MRGRSTKPIFSSAAPALSAAQPSTSAVAIAPSVEYEYFNVVSLTRSRSERTAEGELEVLLAVVRLFQDRQADAHFKRPEGRNPECGDARRGPDVAHLVAIAGRPDVDEGAHARGTLPLEPREGKENLGIAQILEPAAARVALDVLGTDREHAETAHRAHAAEIEVLEERQRGRITVAVARADLSVQHERQIARDREVALVLVGVPVVGEAAAGDPDL